MEKGRERLLPSSDTQDIMWGRGLTMIAALKSFDLLEVALQQAFQTTAVASLITGHWM